MENIELTLEEEKICNQESIYIYGQLIKKYCNENCSNVDIILNSLLLALLRFIHNHVDYKEREIFVSHLINNILKEGIKNFYIIDLLGVLKSPDFHG